MFMEVAEITAKQSNCIKYQVGSVVIMDNRIILQGYNGTIPGFINCNEKFANSNVNVIERIEHHIWSSAFEVHSEMNVICYAAKKGISLEGSTIFCTHSPCNNCLKHLIQSGVLMVIYKNDYNDNIDLEEREQLLKYIKLEKYNDNETF